MAKITRYEYFMRIKQKAPWLKKDDQITMRGSDILRMMEQAFDLGVSTIDPTDRAAVHPGTPKPFNWKDMGL